MRKNNYDKFINYENKTHKKKIIFNSDDENIRNY